MSAAFDNREFDRSFTLAYPLEHGLHESIANGQRILTEHNPVQESARTYQQLAKAGLWLPDRSQQPNGSIVYELPIDTMDAAELIRLSQQDSEHIDRIGRVLGRLLQGYTRAGISPGDTLIERIGIRSALPDLPHPIEGYVAFPLPPYIQYTDECSKEPNFLVDMVMNDLDILQTTVEDADRLMTGLEDGYNSIG